jgi:pimeloyl-ACP methyl ester carboxylesterase
MTRPSSPVRSIGLPLALATGSLALLGAGLAWVAYMRRNIWHDIPLTAALDGELRTLPSTAGEVAYYAGPAAPKGARPLFLIHSVNAAASSYEMKPLFDRFAGGRPVAAIDLPGFGFSERAQRDYRPSLYADAILAAMAHAFDGQPADVVALSLGGEFAALAAAQRPELFASLTLIAPTGQTAAEAAPAISNALMQLRHSGLGMPVFDTLVSRPSLQFFLQQTQRRGFDRGLFHYAYATSHQPNAAEAPYHFIAGRLFTPDILKVYASLELPCLALLAGDPGAGSQVGAAVAGRPNWRVVDWTDRCGSLAHFDDPDGVAQLVETRAAASPATAEQRKSGSAR